MTKYHIEQAKIRYDIDGQICQICGCNLQNKSGSGLAHRISNTKKNKCFGQKMLNHNFNLVPTCVLCNQKMLLDNKPQKKVILYSLIKDRGYKKLTSQEINNFLGVKYE